MKSRHSWALWTVLLPLGLGGCVMPGEMDETVVNRYQRAMVARGIHPRVGPDDLDSLRPAPSESVGPLPVEDIVETEVTEITETYKVLGTVPAPAPGAKPAPRRHRVEVTRTVKTTTFDRDAKTGKVTPSVAVRKSTPSTAILTEVPKDLHLVRSVRVGAKSGVFAMVRGSTKLVRLSLDDAIYRALGNNLDIRVVSYDPAVSREEMVKAAAAFDYLLFGSTRYAKNEEKSNSTAIGDITRTRDWAVGLRKHTVTGADWTLEWGMTRTWDTGTFGRLFNTRYEPTAALQVSQPLLRGAWPEFNLAQLRVTRLNSKITDADFRAKVEETIAEVIHTYWLLIQARRELGIQEELLEETRKTHQRVRGRQIIDATRATIKQVEASVRIREAVLIRARKNILDIQDSLARLLGDPQINILNRAEVVPTSPLVGEKVHVSATEQLLTALRCNPLLEQARLAIAAAAINVSVAKNQTLPKLNLTASTGVTGLGRSPGNAGDKFLTGDYVSYSLGLELEYPIGNRQRLAGLRQRKLERTKTIVSMQNIADQIAVAVQERTRQIDTTYEENLAQRAAVAAAAIQLQALEDTERIRARLTPEFLRVKLQAQETLANAKRAELQALVDYNGAMADLARTTGTILELHRVKIALPAVIGQTYAGLKPPPATMPAGKP